MEVFMIEAMVKRLKFGCTHCPASLIVIYNGLEWQCLSLGLVFPLHLPFFTSSSSSYCSSFHLHLHLLLFLFLHLFLHSHLLFILLRHSNVLHLFIHVFLCLFRKPINFEYYKTSQWQRNAMGLQNLHGITLPHLVGIKGGHRQNADMLSLWSQVYSSLHKPSLNCQLLQDERDSSVLV